MVHTVISSSGNITVYATDDPVQAAKDEAKKQGLGVYVNRSVSDTTEPGVTVYASKDGATVTSGPNVTYANWQSMRSSYGHESEFQSRT
jgi:hypothetical protein